MAMVMVMVSAPFSAHFPVHGFSHAAYFLQSARGSSSELLPGVVGGRAGKPGRCAPLIVGVAGSRLSARHREIPGTAEERAGAGAKSVASVVPSAVGWRGSRARGVNGSDVPAPEDEAGLSRNKPCIDRNVMPAMAAVTLATGVRRHERGR